MKLKYSKSYLSLNNRYRPFQPKKNPSKKTVRIKIKMIISLVLPLI